MDAIKAAGAFIGIVVAGLLWNQFAGDTGADMKKEIDEGRQQWERNPVQVKPVVPTDGANGPGWNPPQRPVPPPVNMPASGKK